MAVRQYVGARYVPKFSDVNGGVWDNTNTYEPLTIVKYNNDYYTSKREVPVGVAITNTDYWILTGNYNGAIAELHDEIDGINDRLDFITHDARNILCISDSYGMSDGNGGWCGALETKAANLPWNIYAQVHSGSGFEADHDQFITLLNTWITANPTLLDSITDVIVAGGYNDAYYELTDEQANSRIGAFVTRVNETMPNATVHVGFIAYTSETDTYYKLPPCCKKYRKYAAYYGAKFVENWQYVARNSYKLADTRHPNATGYSDLADFLMVYLVNGEADWIDGHVKTDLVTIETGFNNPFDNITIGEMVNQGVVVQEKINGHVITRFRPFPTGILTATDPYATGVSLYCDGNRYTKIGTVKGFTFGESNYANPGSTPCMVRVGSTSDFTWNVPVDFFIQGGDLLFRLARFSSAESFTCYGMRLTQLGFEIVVDDSM